MAEKWHGKAAVYKLLYYFIYFINVRFMLPNNIAFKFSLEKLDTHHLCFLKMSVYPFAHGLQRPNPRGRQVASTKSVMRVSEASFLPVQAAALELPSLLCR